MDSQAKLQPNASADLRYAGFPRNECFAASLRLAPDITQLEFHGGTASYQIASLQNATFPSHAQTRKWFRSPACDVLKIAEQGIRVLAFVAVFELADWTGFSLRLW